MRGTVARPFAAAVLCLGALTCKDGTGPGPAIGLDRVSVTFEATAGGGNPAAQAVAVTNSGGGTLGGLSVTVSYAAGQATGWLTATLSGRAAPASLTLQVTTGALQPGTYTATVAVTAPGAANGSQTVTVRLVVVALPAIALDKTSVNFEATAGGPDPGTQTVAVTNSGGGTLSGLAVGTITYGADQPTRWLAAVLDQTTGPATLTLGATTGTLGAGTYSASVPVTSAVAANSPQNVSVTFTVVAQPAIALDPATVTFAGATAGPAPAAKTVAVTNSGGATLSGLAVGAITYGAGQPTGWLTAAIDQATAPATLTLQATTGGLASGTYEASVPITSAVAANSPQAVSVTFPLAGAPPAAPTNLTATVVSRTEVSLGWTDNASDEDGFAVERCTGAECTDFALLASLPPDQTTMRNAGLAPATTYRYRVRADNGFGMSPYSNIAGATTLARLAVTAIGEGAVTSQPAGIDCGAGGTACLFDFPGGAVVTLIATPAAGWEFLGWIGSCTGTGACEVVMEGDREVGASFSSTAAVIVLSPVAVTFEEVLAGGPDPGAQTVAVTNGGGGTLDQLAVGEIAYGADEPGGWLAATLDQASAPATLTLQATTGTLGAGTYHATVAVASVIASNSPQTVAVTFTIGAAAADLAVTGLDGAPLTVSPTSVSQGGSVTLSGFTVTNLGSAASGPFDLGIYLSTDAVLTPEDLLLVGDVFPSLAPGASTDIPALPLAIPVSVAAGSYYIGVLVDGPGAISESDEGNNSVSLELVVTPAPLPPAAPSNLVASAVSASQITLTWTDNSGNEDGFRIERCTVVSLFDCSGVPGTGGVWLQVASVGPDVTTFQNTGLSPSTQYWYRVYAFNAGGTSAPAIAAATTLAANTPTGLVATAASVSQINLSWTDNSTSETGFQIWRCRGAGCTNFAQVATVATNVTSYQDAGLGEATSYSYRVRAVTGSGTSGFSNTASATTLTASAPPPAPSGFTATAVSGNQVNLAWIDNATDEAGFRVERCTVGVIDGIGGGGCASTEFVEIAVLEANRTSYEDAGLAGSTLYQYRVRAYNSAGSSAYAVAQATTPPVPKAPTGLTATAVSHSQIDLAWTDNSTDEDGFRIERCSGTGCTNFAQIATVGASLTTFASTGLSSNRSYSYRVRAFNANGNSPYSNTATATTLPLPAPSELTATALSSGRIRLDWTNNTIGHGFEIERCAGAGCTNFVEVAQFTGGSATSYTNTGLTAATSYSYRVRTFVGATRSPYSNTATATTLPAPTAPAGLAATAVSSSQINLTWTDISINETSFRIERCSGTGCTNFIEIASVGAGVTSYLSTGLAAATSYSYRVRARDADGNHSDYSNTATATTQPAPAAPSGLSATAVSSTEIRLTWTDNSTTETGFRIERCIGAGCTSFVEIAAVSAGVTSYANVGLTAGTTYSYRVRAHDAVHNSAYSDTATATTPGE